MAAPTSSSTPAGGVLIAIGMVVGAVTGVLLGQATIGFLLGTAIGGGAAIAIWWRHRSP